MSIDAVIFDCDGVLVDSEVCAIRGERRVLSALGLDYEHDAFVRRFVGLHDSSFFEALQGDFTTRLGRTPPEGWQDQVLAARAQEMAYAAAIAGADRALAAVREAGLGLAIASSSRAGELVDKLKRGKLWDLAAPHVYSADLVTAGKPAPDIYLLAAERLQARPERCIAVEDSVNGVRSARAAGMAVWGFSGGGHMSDDSAERLLQAGASGVAASFDALMAMALGANRAMNAPLTIREGVAGDIEPVRALLFSSWMSAYREIYGPERVVDLTRRWHTPEVLARDMDRTDATFLLAERQGQLIAHAFAHAEADVIHLSRLYVDPGAYRSGAGGALLAAVTRRFPSAAMMRLEVDVDNDRGVAFYLKHGFAEVGRTGTCGGEANLPALIMEKALTPAAAQAEGQGAQT